MTSDISHAAAPLMKLRRTIPFFLLFALGIGTLASIDALHTALTTPEHEISLAAGDSAELSGSLSHLSSQFPPRIRVDVTPETPRLTISKITTSPALLTSDTNWHATLTLADDAVRKTLNLEVTFPDLPHQPPELWTLQTYPSATALHHDSRSVFLSVLHVEPLKIAFSCLFFATLLTGLYPALTLWERKTLVKKGFLRVFHARDEGDDTLLYCVYAKDDVRLLNDSYRVVSATGQLLGLAILTEKGRRHCVFRLRTARARAGCLIAIH